MSRDTGANSSVGILELSERYRSIPRLLEATLDVPWRIEEFLSSEMKSVDVVGVGASEAPARLFVSVLAAVGIPVRFVPISSFLEPWETVDGGKDSVLVVFSQGLSPNAQMALGQASHYGASALLTSVDPAAAGQRAEACRSFKGCVLWHPPLEERGSLVRLVGPVCASALGLRFASALITAQRGSPPRFSERLSEVPSAYGRIVEEEKVPLLRDPAACLALGVDAELSAALMWKWQEGLYTRLPVATDVLSFAHGPLQSLYDREAVILLLSRDESPAGTDVYERLRRALHPTRHQVRRLRAALPFPLSYFEFDAHVTGLLLEEIRARGIDPCTWPGQATDEPLYSVREPSRSGASEK